MFLPSWYPSDIIFDFYNLNFYHLAWNCWLWCIYSCRKETCQRKVEGWWLVLCNIIIGDTSSRLALFKLVLRLCSQRYSCKEKIIIHIDFTLLFSFSYSNLESTKHWTIYYWSSQWYKEDCNVYLTNRIFQIYSLQLKGSSHFKRQLFSFRYFCIELNVLSKFWITQSCIYNLLASLHTLSTW